MATLIGRNFWSSIQEEKNKESKGVILYQRSLVVEAANSADVCLVSVPKNQLKFVFFSERFT